MLAYLLQVAQVVAIVAGGLGVAVTGFFYVIKTRHEINSGFNRESIVDLKTAVESRDLKIVDMQKAHEQQLNDLQKQITILQSQVATLQQANTVLQNTVTGKEILAEIQKTLNQFLPYVDAFPDFKKNDEEIIRLLKKEKS